jgi:hypothetical protein
MSTGRLHTFPFGSLAEADLVLDAIYEGQRVGNTGDDPIARLLPVGNQGGFRYKGSPASGNVRLVVLYTSGKDVDWPDTLDEQTSLFTYYGDNKRPGRELHDTQRRGNLILRDAFALAAGSAEERRQVPPFFLFQKAGVGRDVLFRGLLVPGAAALRPDEGLVAIWRSRDGRRFQNYRAKFTVLDTKAPVSRAWLTDVANGYSLSPAAPPVWRRWVEAGTYAPLLAPRTTIHRSRSQQLPQDREGLAMAQAIYEHFHGRDTLFEACAARLWQLIAPAVSEVEITRPTRDEGRDAVGTYSIGPDADQVKVDFALEAKCYNPSDTRGVGVKETARLISRLLHRQFGVLVATAFVGETAYREIRQDGHPVVIVSAVDIVTVLRQTGINGPASVSAWLKLEFPIT